jgi:beta-glucuronidase
MVIMGSFLGSWTVGSGVSWKEGTDYTNPVQCENMKKSIKAMVLDNKDEPYVLMWQLGNENNVATWSNCNARKEPVAYAKLIGEIADMIHQIDPEHPVAICDGDDMGRMLPYYAKYAPGIDIVSYNSYRGAYGFGTLWNAVKRNFDRPVFMSEWGVPAYNIHKGEDEDFQATYIKGCWRDIAANKAGNSIGGTVFEWIDMWWQSGNPIENNPSTKRMDTFPDKLNHEEWFGIVSMGDGNDSLMRQKRKAYDYLRSVWNETNVR